MKNVINIFASVVFILLYQLSIAQVAINTDNSDADASAILDLKSTNKGLLIPRITTNQRNNISNPAEGLLVYDINTNTFWFYDNGWNQLGNDDLGNHTATQNLQLNGKWLSKDGDNEGIYVQSNGNVGIGRTPAYPLHVKGDRMRIEDVGTNNGLEIEGINNPSIKLLHDYVGAVTPQEWLLTGNSNIFFLKDGTGGTQPFTVKATAPTHTLFLDNTGDVGIGTNDPKNKLHVDGSIRMVDGNQSNGYIATSDANGKMTWTNPSVLNQTLSLNTNTLSLSNGGSVDLSIYENSKTAIVQDADNDTKIQVEESNDEDIIRFDIDNTEYFRIEKGRIANSNTNGSIFIGNNTGGSNYNFNLNYSYDNIAIGEDALSDNSFDGYGNIAIGKEAGKAISGEDLNTIIGYKAMPKDQGQYNTIIGANAMLNSDWTSYRNVIIGYNAAKNVTTGSSWFDNNTIVGTEAGGGITGTVQKNVYLGFGAGYNETNSHRLYIENSTADHTGALIYGEFDNDLLRINGTLNLNGAFAFPTVDGSNGQVLVSNGNGTLSWVDKNQSLSLNTNTLSLTDGGSVDLSAYKQSLSLNTNTLSLSDGGSVDLSAYLDADDLGNHTATQDVELKAHDIIFEDVQAGGNIILTGNDVNANNKGLVVRNSIPAVDGNRFFSLIRNNNDLFTVYDNGNAVVENRLGIGETSPSTQLHVKDNNPGGFVATIENTGSGSNVVNGLMIKSGHNTYIQGVNNRFISFRRPDGQEIGAVRQLNSAYVDFWSPSDRRLKINLQPSQYGLDNLLQIEVMDYHYKSDTSQLSTGFIAQQLHQHFPEAVSVGGENEKNDPWMVSYDRLTPLLVKAVQEQQLQIENLKEENAALKAQVAKVNQLEAMVLELQAQVNNNPTSEGE